MFRELLEEVELALVVHVKGQRSLVGNRGD